MRNREDPAPLWPCGFHTGYITTTEISAAQLDSSAGPPTGAFSYVYDCGSEQSEAFSAELALYRERSGGGTDILSVSQLSELPANRAWVKTSNGGGTIVRTVPWFRDKTINTRIGETVDRIKGQKTGMPS